MAGLDTAGRKIAGLLGYNPGPGIYSRLERAIQAMPANVRAQELPGLLKRYKEGVPGWELRAADLDSVIAGRDVVPQDELLAAVRERSPVFTHGEMLLQGRMEPRPIVRPDGDVLGVPGSSLTGMRPLGRGVAVGDPKYADYGQGGANYGELLLIQPGAEGTKFGSHWSALPGGMLRSRAAGSAVAHARFDTHGDALRINELQSDLGIYNRKMRERDNWSPPLRDDQQPLTFPLEDAWADILIKRLALEAARGGHRAIEVASPRAIANKVGGNIDNYEHFYGKVVPGAIERLGRKMGGLTPSDTQVAHQPALAAAERALSEEMGGYTRASINYGVVHPDTERSYRNLMLTLEDSLDPEWTGEKADELFGRLIGLEGRTPAQAGLVMTRLMELAGRHGRAMADHRNVFDQLYQANQAMRNAPARRYIMSDEMRRRLIEGGVGASLLGGLATADTEE